jgi:hypothetical protein
MKGIGSGARAKVDSYSGAFPSVSPQSAYRPPMFTTNQRPLLGGEHPFD